MARRRRRFRQPAGGHGNNDRWLLTYADVITLLMVFFAVLFAISNTDLRKFAALTRSLSRAFNVDVLAGYETFTVTTGIDTQPQTQRLDLGVGALATSQYQSIRATVMDAAISSGLGEQVDVSLNTEGITIRISGSLLFSSGRATLDGKSVALLGRIEESIKALTNDLRVEGHTDDVPPPANSFYHDNWQLSSARALAVLDHLVAAGVDPARLSAAGYASYHPLVPNTSEANRTRNRRVDIVILFPTASGGVGSPGDSSGIVAPITQPPIFSSLEPSVP